MPVSLIGTFVLFPLFGFSINTLSLFGLVLAIGLVVDDAIVVVEAVERHIEEGMTPRDATLQAMREVSGPVIGIALVLSAVFIPTAFLPGYHRPVVSTVRANDCDLRSSSPRSTRFRSVRRSRHCCCGRERKRAARSAGFTIDSIASSAARRTAT